MSEAVDGAPNEAITQAERSVLGAMLLAEGAIRDVLELGLKPENFYDPKAQTIFAEICSVFMSGGSADPVTVSNGLLARGELARVGGAAALHALVAEVPTATNANYYAAIVRDAAIKRSLATAAARLAQQPPAAHRPPTCSPSGTPNSTHSATTPATDPRCCRSMTCSCRTWNP